MLGIKIFIRQILAIELYKQCGGSRKKTLWTLIICAKSQLFSSLGFPGKVTFPNTLHFIRGGIKTNHYWNPVRTCPTFNSLCQDKKPVVTILIMFFPNLPDGDWAFFCVCVFNELRQPGLINSKSHHFSFTNKTAFDLVWVPLYTQSILNSQYQYCSHCQTSGSLHPTSGLFLPGF